MMIANEGTVGPEELQSLSTALPEQLSERPQRSSPLRRPAAYHSDLDLIRRSQAFIEVVKQVDRVANTDMPVLLIGESGTGKELVASEIHHLSGRSDQSFVAVNCGAIPAELIEAELFGRDRPGLWEEADGGTVFLDEITQTNSSFQLRLLRALQTQSVNVRLIAASSRNIEQEVAAGRFRSDLFEQLNAESIVLPPLRDRREDIPPLAQTFADRVYSLSPSVKFSSEALALLEQYNWPGNIRELENAVVRAVAMCDGTIRVKDLPEHIRNHSLPPEDAVQSEPAIEDWVTLSEIEGRYVARVLEHTGGNKLAAARILAVDRKTLDRMIKRHNINSHHLRSDRAKASGRG